MRPLSVLAGKFSCCQVIVARKVVAFYSDSVETTALSGVAEAQQWWGHRLWRWLKPCQIALTRVKWIPAISAKLTHRTAQWCGITKMTSGLRDGLAGGAVCSARERASVCPFREPASVRPPQPEESPNTSKEKSSENQATLCSYSGLHGVEAINSAETER